MLFLRVVERRAEWHLLVVPKQGLKLGGMVRFVGWEVLGRRRCALDEPIVLKLFFEKILLSRPHCIFFPLLALKRLMGILNLGGVGDPLLDDVGYGHVKLFALRYVDVLLLDGALSSRRGRGLKPLIEILRNLRRTEYFVIFIKWLLRLHSVRWPPSLDQQTLFLFINFFLLVDCLQVEPWERVLLLVLMVVTGGSWGLDW